MPVCFKCFCDCGTPTKLITHLQFKHSIRSGSHFKCCDEGCVRTFQNIHSFKKHLQKQHYRVINPNVDIQASSSAGNVGRRVTIEEQNTILGIIRPINESPSDTPDFVSLIKNEAISVMTSLYSIDRVPREYVQHVIDIIVQFLHGSAIDDLRSSILNTLKECGSNLTEDIKSKFHSLVSSFDALDTEYKRFKCLTDIGVLQKTTEITIGTNLENKVINGQPQVDVSLCKGTFISLRDTLQSFLSMSGVLDSILNYVKALERESENISNLMQCDHWKFITRNCNKGTVFPLLIYFDEFETCNPLGASAGVHKIGAVYASLPCLPVEVRSHLENIFLVLLFHSQDRVTFGNHAVFKELISELTSLYNDGLTVNINNKVETIFFVVPCLIGDNLGLHGILGFTECFRSNFSCRFCKVNKDDSKCSTRECKDLLRDNDNYYEDVRKKDISLTGIKEDCVWNNLEYFHVTNNYSVDIMHDLLEGVCIYDIGQLLHQFVMVDKLFSLEILNSRIQLFALGENDSKNRPGVITHKDVSQKKLKMSASQMLCLVRYLGLMIGDLVPVGNEYWTLYTYLNAIVSIVTAPSIQKDCYILLETLIEEHHSTYISLFGKSLKPKHHLMVHYPRIVQMSGPLIHLWSMRFEAKHKELKTSSNASCSRRNITYTIATKHQLKYANRLLSNRGFEDTKKVGPVKPVDYSEELPVILTINSCTTSWVNISGVLYKKNVVVILQVVDFLPQFGVITNIFVNSNTTYFVVKVFKTIYFDDHLCGYAVEDDNLKYTVAYSNLFNNCTSFIVTVSDGRLFIPLRYSM
jgi:hypothetical protein